MLTLRLTLTATPAALLLRLLLLCASAGGGLLLLAALSYALEHPGHRVAVLTRLLWCLIPLAATAQPAAVLGRTEPRAGTRLGLHAAGLGPARLPLLAARTAAVPGLAGSALTLLLTVRGGVESAGGSLSVLNLPRPSALLPLQGPPLPVPAAVTLLSVLPAVAALAAAWGARPGAAAPEPSGSGRVTDSRRAAESARRDGTGTPYRAGLLRSALQAVSGLLTGTAGLLLAAHAARGTGRGARVPAELPGAVAGWPFAAGWTLIGVGLVVAGPGLVALSGHLLGVARPGPVRLLAGRSLVREAAVAGRPLGALSAVAAALVAVVRAHLTGAGLPAPGPLLVLAAALTGCCTAAAGLAALARVRRGRAPVRELLDRLGAPRQLGRGVALLRAAATAAVCAPLVAAGGLLTALPTG
ncbi:hypothetical protein [Streptomyces sp. AA1529]|uniref:hypothetical protein n=1 Tax=Streptomyces sp. AA1529 TaxID=1203257 RepID=UPI0002E857CB|nr:hypothetical protein [Streptomyces sp. AA1529]